MDEFKTQNFETASHGEELDFIFKQDSDTFDEVIFENRDLVYDCKMYFRLFRKKFFSFMREKMQKNFTNIVYLTLDCPPFTTNSLRKDSPLEYIEELRKQYPDNDIRVLIPIINLEEEFRPSKKMVLNIEGKQKVVEKTSVSFTFFLQNKLQHAILYKFPKNKSNIQVYGLCSPSFSFCKDASELAKLQYLAPFIKSARIAIKKLKRVDFTPDIVHAENIPFFLGGEFEINLPYHIKVLQGVKDFTQVKSTKTEAFWAAINLADKNAMKKICKDSMIRKCVASLFNLHNTKRFYQMKDCLRYIYKNYYKFRKYVDQGEAVDENFIFNRLNARITQLFPQMAQGDKLYFNPMLHSIKRADMWVVTSKTYYKEIFENPALTGNVFNIIEKTKEKSRYVSYGFDMSKYPLENTREIYHNFNIENFREEREKNKKAILKEFSIDRIKTNFVDPTLFKGEGAKILGNLDSFYDAPLFFVNPTEDVFANGTDIIFNTILKLFELHKNIQVIICIKNGLSSTFVKNWIEFLSKNRYLNGKWVFIDGEINPQKFLAASDMTLIPRRLNMITPEHFLAMHYGCIPITSRCGILNDTISDIFDDISGGCGFKAKTSLLSEEDANEIFISPVLKALSLYQNNPSSWNLLIKNCMNFDSKWDFEKLEKYNKIYSDLL